MPTLIVYPEATFRYDAEVRKLSGGQRTFRWLGRRVHPAQMTGADIDRIEIPQRSSLY
jgi:hypothetical protein